MEIKEYIERSNRAQNFGQLFEMLEKALNSCGYDRVLFSLLTEHNTLGLPKGHGIMQNYPDDWMQHYTEKRYFDIDPVCTFVFSTNGPFLWDELPLYLELSPRQKECLFGGINAGMNNGAAVSLRGANGEVAGVGAACQEKDKLDPYAPYLLNIYSQQFYVAFRTLMKKSDYSDQRVYLTDRERETLIWTARGKSAWDIGEILGVSESTVEFHRKNIFAKLNTQNGVAAVVKALHLGLITL